MAFGGGGGENRWRKPKAWPHRGSLAKAGENRRTCGAISRVNIYQLAYQPWRGSKWLASWRCENTLAAARCSKSSEESLPQLMASQLISCSGAGGSWLALAPSGSGWRNRAGAGGMAANGGTAALAKQNGGNLGASAAA